MKMLTFFRSAVHRCAFTSQEKSKPPKALQALWFSFFFSVIISLGGHWLWTGGNSRQSSLLRSPMWVIQLEQVLNPGHSMFLSWGLRKANAEITGSSFAMSSIGFGISPFLMTTVIKMVRQVLVFLISRHCCKPFIPCWCECTGP